MIKKLWQKLNNSRKERAFFKKDFSWFKGFSIKQITQIFLEGESPTLTSLRFKYLMGSLESEFIILLFNISTTLKVSVFGVLWFIFSNICAEYGYLLLNLRIQSKCGKIRTRKTPKTDSFHGVQGFDLMLNYIITSLSTLLRSKISWFSNVASRFGPNRI